MLSFGETTSDIHVHSRVAVYPLSVGYLYQSLDQPLGPVFSSGLEVVGFYFVVVHFDPKRRYAAFQKVVPAKVIMEAGE